MRGPTILGTRKNATACLANASPSPPPASSFLFPTPRVLRCPKGSTMNDNPHKLLTIAEASEEYGLWAESTAYTRISEGRLGIPLVRIGNRVKLRRADIEEFILNSRVPA